MEVENSFLFGSCFDGIWSSHQAVGGESEPSAMHEGCFDSSSSSLVVGLDTRRPLTLHTALQPLQVIVVSAKRS
jgi:hypothetical protein